MPVLGDQDLESRVVSFDGRLDKALVSYKVECLKSFLIEKGLHPPDDSALKDRIHSQSGSVQRALSTFINNTIELEETVISFPPSVQILRDSRFIPLDEEETRRINAIFNCELVEASYKTEGRVLIENSSIPLNHYQIGRLRPGEWLTDENINAHMSMLQERDNILCLRYPSRKKSHFFNSYFMAKPFPSSGVYDFAAIKSWTRRLDPFELDKIYFPINKNQAHWVKVVIYMQQKRICYYDSYHKNGDEYLAVLLRWLGDVADTKSYDAFDRTLWTCVNVKDCPLQLDNSSCGIHIIKIADFVSDNIPINEHSYGQEHMDYFRMAAARDLLKGSFPYPL